MAGDRKKTGDDAPRSAADGPSWSGLLQAAGARLMPLVVSASALVGFVAFAGAVIVWTRFFAVKVPPDQIVAAVPRGELVATGSSLLLLFGFFGVITAVATYLIDRGGRATPGMARGLLIILGLEGVTAIVIDAGGLSREALPSVAVYAVLLLAMISTTLSDKLTSISDSLPPRRGERVKPRPRLAVPWLLDRLPWGNGKRTETLRRQRHADVEGEVVKATEALEKAREDARGARPPGRLGIAAGAARPSRPTAEEVEAEHALGCAEENLESLESEEDADRVGWLKVRPNQLKFSGWGVFVALMLMGFAIAAPAFLREKPWIAVSLGAATLLAIGLWRIAALSKRDFLWFGLAAFISVPLFGTLTLMAQNLDDPQVQPVAFIRTGDAPDEAIQGLYVTEGDDRVYFATVATEGCSDEIRGGSGRLLWVPKSEVVAMSVGPLQSVKDAARTALEMAVALTPAVETPTGRAIDLHADAGEEESAADGAERLPRLENSGPAVRPTFGRGIGLDLESATANDVVSLSLSEPAESSDGTRGFGRARKGKTLRVGGVEAPIHKEVTARAHRAEFVKLEGGKILPLDKEGVHIRDGGKPFVRLDRRSGVTRSLQKDKGENPKDADGIYLQLTSPADDQGKKAGADPGPHELASEQEVEFRNDKSRTLQTRLFRQAWYEDRIKFKVPKDAPSGVVTVECEQLAGQSLLQLSEGQARQTVGAKIEGALRKRR